MKPVDPYRPSKIMWVLRGAGLIGVVLITVAVTTNRDRIEGFAALGYGGAFLAMLFSNATLILPAPGLIIVFALGSSLNPILVGLLGALGATLGELTGYATGYSGLALMDETVMAHVIRRWMARNGVLTIFTLSIIPNPFFDVAGVMAGAGQMSVWRFLSVSFVGKSIQSIGIALAGMLSVEWIEQWLVR